MNELILFVLKSTFVSGILFTWYLLALKNKRLHNYNRFFLLFTLYASIQVPLLHFNWSPVYEKPLVLFTSAKATMQTINGTNGKWVAQQYMPATDINWQAIAMVVAALISLGFLATMFTRIVWILRVGKRYPLIVIEGTTLIRTDLPKAPFSFMNKIFWRDNISPETESGRMILRHELAHIKQKHTYDKLVCQLMSSIFWMNPFYWIIQQELVMVHEFIADEKAIVNNTDGIKEEEFTETLAKMLLHVHNQASYVAPEHQFFSSPIKRRLTMLQTNKKIRASILRRAALIPLLAGSILIFSFNPRVAIKNAIKKGDKKIVLVVDAGHGGNDGGCSSGSLIEKELTLKVAKRIMDLAPGYNIEAHLTRSNDINLALEERLLFSNKLHPDDFISIHINDRPGKDKENGTFDVGINTKNAMAAESKRLAYAILSSASRSEWSQNKASLTQYLSEKNSYYILGENVSAAALIEIGDIKNRKLMHNIEDDSKLDELCNSILKGVVDTNKE